MRLILPFTVALFGFACSTQNTAAPEPAEDAGRVVFPPTPYRSAAPIALPPGSSSIDALAVDYDQAILYVAAGSQILRTNAASGTALAPWLDLSSTGVRGLSTLRVINGGDLEGATSSAVVRIRTAGAGTVAFVQPLSPAFGAGGFGAPALALSPDGGTLYSVEGGSGSAGTGGKSVVHAARFSIPPGSPLDDAGASALKAAEIWELSAPFEVVPSTTSVINASAPFVANDGNTLYVAHVVLRTLFAVDATSVHSVTAVDTDSLQRSAGSFSLDPKGVLIEAANFDQTVCVFQLDNARKASLLVEIPTGGSPGAVAGYGKRVFVAQGGSSGSFPAFEGGVPNFEGGLPSFEGGIPFPPSSDGGSAPTLQVYEVDGAQ